MSAGSYAVHVHAGTGFTDAEAFGGFLTSNAEAIARAGWDLALCDSDDGAATAAALASAGHGAGEGLLISDASLPGSARILLEGRFYPDARSRAAALARSIGREVARLVLVVQPYDAVFLRAWRSVPHRDGAEFVDLAPRLAQFDGGWLDVVSDLQEGLGARRVIVLAAPQEPRAILSHLVPGMAAEMLRPDPADSAVAAGFRAAMERLAAQGLRLAPGQRERLMARHARLTRGIAPSAARIEERMPAGFGFSGLPLADLRGRYVADLDSLSRLPGVSLIGGYSPARPALAAE